MRTSSGSYTAFLLALTGAIVLAVLGTTPPAARAPGAHDTQFSALRAMADVRRIARAPHPSGSVELARLGDFLERRLTAMGLEVHRQSGVFPEPVRERLDQRSGGALAKTGAPMPLVNIVGVLPGRDRNAPALALMAHYDSVFGSPGAADDGAGVAAILETVHHLARLEGRRRDLVVILTDGEEADLTGARLFFAKAPEARRIGAIINLEARGGGGRANLFQTSAANGEVTRTWARHATSPAGTSLATFIYSLLPNDTDLTVALPKGYAAWNFAFIGRPRLYHSPLASADNLDTGSLQQMGDQTLGLARALLRAERMPQKAPDRVFFDVFGLFVIGYAPGWGWVMLALGLAGLGAGVAGRVNGRDVLAGAGGMLGLLVGLGVLLTGLNALSRPLEGANYYDRLAAIPLLQAMALLASLGALALLRGGARRSASARAGFILPLLVLGVVGQVLAPVAAYFVVIPVSLCALGLVMRRLAPRGLALAIEALIAALVTGYALVLGFSLLQAVGPVLPAVAALPVALAAMAFDPLWGEELSLRATRALGAVCLLGALLLALWVRFDPIAPSVPPYSDARPILGHD